MSRPSRLLRLTASLAATALLGLASALPGAAPADANPAPVEPFPGGPENLASQPPEESFLAAQRRQRDNGRGPYADLPDGGEVAVGDVLRLTLDRGVIRAESTPLVGPDAQRFRLRGADAVCTVAVVPVPLRAGDDATRGGGVSVDFTRYDAGVANDTDLWATFVSAGAGGTYLSVTGQSVVGRVTLSQNLAPARPPARAGAAAAPQPVTLRVNAWRDGPRLAEVFRGSAATLPALRARYPDAFRAHAIPLLAKVSDLRWLVPGPAEAYRVFADIPADPAVAARLDGLLARLDADAYPARQAAAQQLMDLGPPGVLAALRVDTGTLSDEQKGQLGRLVAAHRRQSIDDPDAARSDPTFLTDCLEHEDPAVRRAAKAGLEKVLGRPIAFDPDAPPDARAAAADAARKLIAPALVPSTQPAATQPAGG